MVVNLVSFQNYLKEFRIGVNWKSVVGRIWFIGKIKNTVNLSIYLHRYQGLRSSPIQ